MKLPDWWNRNRDAFASGMTGFAVVVAVFMLKQF